MKILNSKIQNIVEPPYSFIPTSNTYTNSNTHFWPHENVTIWERSGFQKKK